MIFLYKYKVVIIDDEPWILEGIFQTFAWEKYGFKVIKKLTSSIEGLDIILNEKPDVVFTDIRMPEISGIELMKLVRKEGLDTEFIIISGFDDFSYAQDALRQGAFDYHLKPIKANVAEKILGDLAKILEDKRADTLTKQFDELVEGEANIEEKLKKFGFKEESTYYQVIVAIGESASLEGDFISFPEGITPLKIKLSDNKYFYLIGTDCDIYKKIKLTIKENINVGISSLAKNLADLGKLFRQANQAAYNKFIYQKNGIYRYQEQNIEKINNIIEEIFLQVENKNYNGIEFILDSFPSVAEDNEMFINDIVYFWNQMVAHLNENLSDELQKIDLEFLEYENIIDRFEDIESLCQYLKDTFISLNQGAEIIEEGIDNKSFRAMIEYIEENYHKNLYLKDLANKFFFNHTYCCHLFKKFTDKTFSQYLTDLRMKKAKELLKDLSLSISEVANKAGYNDYYYFNKVFKKYYGITPYQHRKGIE